MIIARSLTFRLPLARPASHSRACSSPKSLRTRPSVALATLKDTIEDQSMTIQRLDVGPRLSEATIHAGTVYLAGQVPEDTSADMKGQAESVLKSIDELLARAGTDKSKVLMAQVYVIDLAEFPAFNEVWDKWVVPGATPARATVQVTQLANPGWKLEIVITAAV